MPRAAAHPIAGGLSTTASAVILGAALALALALALPACASFGPFDCDEDVRCGDGRCEDDGYCSFTDESCHSGWRYGEHGASTLASSCVGDTTGAIAALAAGAAHTCAVADDGAAWCWGNNDEGALASEGDDSSRPLAVAGLSALRAIDGGALSTCAITDGGAAWCWGMNDHGQLGDGTKQTRVTPAAIAGLADVEQVDLGATHACVRTGAGDVACWGSNGDDELGQGNGNGNDATTPVAVAVADARALTVNGHHACAIRGDARDVVCWGNNTSGELGGGDDGRVTSPQPAPAFAGALAVGAGGGHTCALMPDATVRCVGLDAVGQLGDGLSGVGLVSLTPVTVAGLAATAIAVGGQFTCAIDTDGAVRCWGSNDNGELGDGTAAQRGLLGPAVDLPAPAIALTAGERHACAQTDDGCIWCWGQNSSGQLGARGADSPTPLPSMLSCW
jgi:alpha-tubulin suppressor-like RCC1 family protein